jgi:hypothetical protein
MPNACTTWFLDETITCLRLLPDGRLHAGLSWDGGPKHAPVLRLHVVVLAGGVLVRARLVAETSTAAWIETVRLALAGRGAAPLQTAISTDQAAWFSTTRWTRFVQEDLCLQLERRHPFARLHGAVERVSSTLDRALREHVRRTPPSSLEALEEALPGILAATPQPVEA